uniref:Uncharacterized protein n=1 Tax=Arundo donax TaxID=35708 RepID=A0A0A9B409_ARUDO
MRASSPNLISSVHSLSILDDVEARGHKTTTIVAFEIEETGLVNQ